MTKKADFERALNENSAESVTCAILLAAFSSPCHLQYKQNYLNSSTPHYNVVRKYNEILMQNLSISHHLLGLKRMMSYQLQNRCYFPVRSVITEY